MPYRGYQALRRGRASLPGQPYLLTTVCAARRRWFEHDDIARTVAGSLANAEIWSDATLLSWVLMPDHWHALVVLGNRRTLSATMQHAKGASSRDAARSFGVCPLWQPGFHDRALRDDVDLRVAARYVVANPLRAGLVSDIRKYRYWWSAWGEDALSDPFG
jgi:REP element-mobilizing transposase RayT